MRQNYLLLAVDSSANDRLFRLLTGLGYSVLAVDTAEKALTKIRHLDLAAAVLGVGVDIDPLELVLSIREIDEKLPIVVVALAEDDGMLDTLLEQYRVFVVTRSIVNLREKTDHVLQEAIAQI